MKRVIVCLIALVMLLISCSCKKESGTRRYYYVTSPTPSPEVSASDEVSDVGQMYIYRSDEEVPVHCEFGTITVDVGEKVTITENGNTTVLDAEYYYMSLIMTYDFRHYAIELCMEHSTSVLYYYDGECHISCYATLETVRSDGTAEIAGMLYGTDFDYGLEAKFDRDMKLHVTGAERYTVLQDLYLCESGYEQIIAEKGTELLMLGMSDEFMGDKIPVVSLSDDPLSPIYFRAYEKDGELFVFCGDEVYRPLDEVIEALP